MARKIKTEKTKKKHALLIAFIVIIVLALLGVGIFFGWKYFKKGKGPGNPVEVKILDSIDEYGYQVSDKDSKYFKSEFDELKKILLAKPVDEEKYATQVAKLFVIDLYTMDTKINKYDIGGNEFIHADKKEMFEQKVIDSLYASMLDNTYGDRKQNLPEVKEVKVVSTEKTNYKLGKETVDAYLVKLEITYVKSYDYDTQASIVLVKENDIKWSIVNTQPTLNPKN